jgi:two-component system OmpR family response regulator
MKTILVVEDDEPIREVVRYALEADGYSVLDAQDAGQALELFENTSVDLVLLDIRLPDKLGFEVAREIRLKSPAPILFLTAVDEDLYELKAFEVGGDDFIRKPFSSAVLLARVKARLKASQQGEIQSLELPRVFSFGDIQLDHDAQEVRCGGELIDLTSTERRMLELLLSNPRKVFSRDEIMGSAYTDGRIVSHATITGHIKNLRSKFEQKGCGDPIRTVQDSGYGMVRLVCSVEA